MARVRRVPGAKVPVSATQKKTTGPTRQVLKELTNTVATNKATNSGKTGALDKKRIKPATERVQGPVTKPTSDQPNERFLAPDAESGKAKSRKSVARTSPKTSIQHLQARTDVVDSGKKGYNSEASRSSSIQSTISLGLSPSVLEGNVPSQDLHNTLDLSLSLSDSDSDSDNISNHSSNIPTSIRRAQSTPSLQASTLILKNFKRRPRQGSILGIVQQKLASARNSAIHIPSDSDSDDSSLDLDASLSLDDDDFDPEAAGTPLAISRPPWTTSRVLRENSTLVNHSNVGNSKSMVAASSKRNHDEIEDPQSGQDSIAGIKRVRRSGRGASLVKKSPDPRHSRRSRASEPDRPIVQVGKSPTPPPLAGTPDLSEASANPVIAVPSTQTRSQNGIQKDGSLVERSLPPASTLADPLSSSPAPDERREGQHVMQQNPSAHNASQDNTSLLNARSRSRRGALSKKVSTAALQSLLPKRRQKPIATRRKARSATVTHTNPDTTDQSVSDDHTLWNDDSDIRHDSYLQTSIRRSALKARSHNAAGDSSVIRKTHQTPMSTKLAKQPPKASERSMRTYGRTARLDKENDSTLALDDDSDSTGLSNSDAPEMSMYEAIKSSELEEARKRFADIDGWDMEFESVSVDEDRSSSQTWR